MFDGCPLSKIKTSDMRAAAKILLSRHHTTGHHLASLQPFKTVPSLHPTLGSLTDRTYGLPSSAAAPAAQHDQVDGMANSCSAHPRAMVSSSHQHGTEP
ncbi:uncharacterized protein LOC135108164 isoform X3 [Scylla paramamosain]|uniref:uncharacterized protein LOC135108164 isoform X3 n=1 Tax=Scylla paramamosain TaxID=85552 RepID=UPI0030830315